MTHTRVCARANAERPEQGRWWAETVTGALADPEVLERADVTLHGGEGWEAARFPPTPPPAGRAQRGFRCNGSTLPGTNGVVTIGPGGFGDGDAVNITVAPG